MTREQKTPRIVRSWLEDGVDVLPERVLEAVLDRLPATPQRRPWWRAWRYPFVSNTFKFVTVGAAVVTTTALVAGLLVARPGPALPLASPSPSTPAETTRPPASSPGAVVPPFGYRVPLPAGTYQTTAHSELYIDITVGDGWNSYNNFAITNWGGDDPPSGLGFWEMRGVYEDVCQWAGTVREPGTSVDEVIGVLRSISGTSTTEPMHVSVAGYEGKYLRLSYPRQLDVSECDGGQLRAWSARLEDRWIDRPGATDELWVLGIDGHVLLVSLYHFAGTPDDDVAELRAVLEAARIRLR